MTKSSSSSDGFNPSWKGAGSVETGQSKPLVKLSQSFQDVRKNADNFILSAQNSLPVRRLKDNLDGLELTLRREAEAKLKGFKSLQHSGSKNLEEWDLLRRLGRLDQKTSNSNVPKSASASRLDRLTSQLVRSQKSGDALQAKLNTQEILRTLNKSLIDSRQAAQLAAFHEQAKQITQSEAARSIEAVAQQLLKAPKTALQTCQQTIGNCQQNFLTLGNYVSRNIAETTGVVIPRLKGNEDEDSGKLSLSWSFLPGYMQPKDVEQLEGVVDIDGALSDDPMGPFQVHKRKRRNKSKSSLRDPGRQVAIVTTAALPWMTGTAVNPLLRAVYLARDASRKVTLLVPWLAKCDQQIVFPKNLTFDTPEEQERYLRDWVYKRTGLESNFKVKFYPGRYAAEKCSILPVGDPTQYIPDDEADVALLEEPEHLTWYHHGRRWTDKFNHVVGIIHTNYLDYARREEGGDIKAALLRHMNEVMCRIHCHKVVKLSDAVQPLPRQVTQFVHGVPESFIAVGTSKAQARDEAQTPFPKGAYFLGKVLWAKGYTELINLLQQQASKGSQFHVDCFGHGEDLPEVKSESERRLLDVSFHGACDHLSERLHDYKLFINPSTSDVVATTTAEALAMGKWVVCAHHPSNAFFSTFPNCLTYKTPEEFSEKVQYALQHEPHPMREEDSRKLTWDDATERLLDVAEISEKDKPKPLEAAVDSMWWMLHNSATGVEALRVNTGAGANTRDNPKSVAAYEPPAGNMGGFFDNKKRAKQSLKR